MAGIEATSKAEIAYQALRDKLVLLDIEPGSPLSEAAVGAELGIGRTPVREAIKRLEADHLIVTYPRKGTFATQVSLIDLTPISEIRQVLVPVAARRAANFEGGAVSAELAEVLSVLKDVANQDQRTLMELDLQVHRLINRAAQSRYLEEVLMRLDNLVTRIWCTVIPQLPPIGDHVDEHISLIEAVLAGDAESAESLAREHVGNFAQVVRSLFDAD